jgi:hypothetical protein
MSQNINSFMAVINATQQVDGGIMLPGDWFPSGRPLKGEGATLADLQKRQMAEQWFENAKGKYEREIAERDHEASVKDAPDLVIGGGDTPAEQPRGDETPKADAGQTLEEELQSRCTFWREKCERLEWEKGVIVKDLAEASKQLLKCEAALDAIREA